MATNASSFLKRGSPSCWPDELTVINDPNHVLFDERLALPVTDERIRNLVAVGQVQPIAVRVEGNELVVRGESTTEQVLEFYPELAEALGMAKKAEAA